MLLLFVAMPIKYLAGDPSAVKLVGMIHGLLFVALVALIAVVGYLDQWNKKLIAFALFSACIPFGMVALDRQMKKQLGA